MVQSRFHPALRHRAPVIMPRPVSRLLLLLGLLLLADHAAGGEPVLLVAAPDMADAHFAHTVVLVTHTDDGGAVGWILNRPAGVRLGAVFPDLPLLAGREDPLYLGGPVAPQRVSFLFRAAADMPRTLGLFGSWKMGVEQGLLEQLLGPNPAGRLQRFFAGHAGWAPGQLDQELAAGAWLLLAPDSAVLEDTDPAGLWERLRQRAGSRRLEVNATRRVGT